MDDELKKLVASYLRALGLRETDAEFYSLQKELLEQLEHINSKPKAA